MDREPCLRKSLCLPRSQIRKIRLIVCVYAGHQLDIGTITVSQAAVPGIAELGRFLGNVPGLLERGARVLGQLDEATRNGLVPSPQIVAEIGRAEARRSRWTLRALWVIAVLLFWLALRHL